MSRYYDLGEGPAPEVVSAERDGNGRTHYELVQDYYRTHSVSDYDLSQYYNQKTGQLTALFYKGDRSMRESGFDPSNRFGPFSIDIIHYSMIMILAMGVGIFIPPIGIGFYVSCSVSESRLEATSKAMLPYFAVLIAGVLVVAFVPWFTLAVPRLLQGH